MNGLVNAIYGTLFTWGLTALGAACVLFVPGNKRFILDISLGFSGGVMLAASYWSLISPALILAEEQGFGRGSCGPVALGLVLGAGFVFLADIFLPERVINLLVARVQTQNQRVPSKEELIPGEGSGIGSTALIAQEPPTETTDQLDLLDHQEVLNDVIVDPGIADTMETEGEITEMTTLTVNHPEQIENECSGTAASESHSKASTEDKPPSSTDVDKERAIQLRRLLLLIIAITVHNFPEGLAVGVGYATVGRAGVDIQSAHNLALGIGLQNFPEGLAVSIPLKAAGFSTLHSFFWGQASGMVEPLAGIIGVLAVSLVEEILAVALSFAAGAMIWVVCNDIIPESASHSIKNSRLCSVGVMVGFIVMMCLDTALVSLV